MNIVEKLKKRIREESEEVENLFGRVGIFLGFLIALYIFFDLYYKTGR